MNIFLLCALFLSGASYSFTQEQAISDVIYRPMLSADDDTIYLLSTIAAQIANENQRSRHDLSYEIDQLLDEHNDEFDAITILDIFQRSYERIKEGVIDDQGYVAELLHALKAKIDELKTFVAHFFSTRSIATNSALIGDTLRVNGRTMTYGPVYINNQAAEPSLAVSGKAFFNDLIATNLTAQNLSFTTTSIADLTITNSLTLNNAALTINTPSGDVINVNSGNFVVDAAGNTTIDGNLTVNGTSTVTGPATFSNTVTLSTLTPAGVVHNGGSGLLSSSLIVNNDIANGTITDTKLAPITTAGIVANSATTATRFDVVNTIVLRDGSGNFATNMITIDGVPTVATDVTTKSYVDNLVSTNSVTALNVGAGAGQVFRNKIGTVLNLKTLLATPSEHITITNNADDISFGTDATSANTPNTIVSRDGSGNFNATMLTITGTTTNATDVATKSYVDLVSSLGLTVKASAKALATTNITLSGLQTIDGVALIAGSRVLLINQTNPLENGLWEVQVGAWTRPADFANGSTTDQAYVLITDGIINAGSSYIATTPTAIVGTNPIQFTQFAQPSEETGANVGTGVGQIFRDKTGTILNFKTISQGAHVIVANNTNDVNIATDATNVNTPNTIVSRDLSGNFGTGAVTLTPTSGTALSITPASGGTGISIGNTTGSAIDVNSGLFAVQGSTGNTFINGSLTIGNNVVILPFTVAGVVHNLSSGQLASSLIKNVDVDPMAGILYSKLNLTNSVVNADVATTAAIAYTKLNLANAIVNADVSPTAGIAYSKLNLANAITVSDLNNAAYSDTAINGTLVYRNATTGNFQSVNPVNVLDVVNKQYTDSLISSVTGANVGSGAGQIFRNKTGNTLNFRTVDGINHVIVGTGGDLVTVSTDATSANTISTVVARDASGNFSAGTITSTGLTVSPFNTAGVVHNNASGVLSSSLITNADVSASAAIAYSKLNVANSIVIADLNTSAYSDIATNGTLVYRNASTGNFQSVNPIATLDVANKQYVDAASVGLTPKTPAVVVGTSNITLSGLQTIDGVVLVANDRVLLVNQTNPVENGLWLVQSGAWTRPADFSNGSTVGQAYVLISSGSVNAGSSYLASTPSAIVGTNNITFTQFSLPAQFNAVNVGAGAGQIFRDKIGNTLNFRTITSTNHITASTSGDLVTITSDATNANTAGTIVARDGSGNFSASTITANLTGNVTGNVTGSSSFNVLKSGDSMTGTLNITPASGVALALTPGVGLDGLTIGNTTANAINVNSGLFTVQGSTGNTLIGGTARIVPFNTTGVVHNDVSGVLSSSLITNADVSASAAIAYSKLNLNNSIVDADIAATAAIVDTKLATISTAGKVANSATTATSVNTANTIVLRDISGNFSAGTITASLTGSASLNVLKAGDTMTGTLTITPSAASTALTINPFSPSSTGISIGSTTGSAIDVNAGKFSVQGSTGDVTITPSSGTALTINPATASVGINIGSTTNNAITVNSGVFTIVGSTGATTIAPNSGATALTITPSGATAPGIVVGNTTGNAINVNSGLFTVQGSTGNVSTSGNIAMVNSTSTAGNITKPSGVFLHNRAGDSNVGVGVSALQNVSSTDNTAVGNAALSNLTNGGSDMTAVGYQALQSVTAGVGHTAVGAQALQNFLGTNGGDDNVALGRFALRNLDVGVAVPISGNNGNVALGCLALNDLRNGSFNVAVGQGTLGALTGSTANSFNIAIGYDPVANFPAGSALTTGSNNISIANRDATAVESNAIRIGNGNHNAVFIAGIFGTTSTLGSTVFVNSSGKLGTLTSSIRFKENIKTLEAVSPHLEAMRAVTFNYKEDEMHKEQVGFIAEEVAEHFPQIVCYEKDGITPNGLRYDLMSALLLKGWQEQQVLLEQQQYLIKALQEKLDQQARRVESLEAAA